MSSHESGQQTLGPYFLSWGTRDLTPWGNPSSHRVALPFAMQHLRLGTDGDASLVWFGGLLIGPDVPVVRYSYDIHIQVVVCLSWSLSSFHCWLIKHARPPENYPFHHFWRKTLYKYQLQAGLSQDRVAMGSWYIMSKLRLQPLHPGEKEPPHCQ